VTPNAHSALIAIGWALGGGVATWVLTIPLRRRSLGYVLASVVLVATVASVSAMVGSFRAMFIGTNELWTSVIVALAAGGVASISVVLSTRRFSKDNAALRDVVADIQHGRIPADGGRKLTSELEMLRAQLANAARELTESRERERAMEASRRELVAWVSHDLRTPLAGLRAMSEALEDGVVESPEIYYKQIRVEVERLTNMVNDLFDLSRIQAGSFAVESEMVALDDVVSDCLAALAPLAKAHGVELTGRSGGSVAVNGDGRELSRAITNLVANAIRHTPAEGRIEVKVEAVTNPPQAEVTVTDACGGIPEDDLPRVFEVGFRGEAARTPLQNGGGAGFGLAITRGIVEAHDGSVDVRNVEGGCRFTIRLPAARAA